MNFILFLVLTVGLGLNTSTSFAKITVSDQMSFRSPEFRIKDRPLIDWSIGINKLSPLATNNSVVLRVGLEKQDFVYADGTDLQDPNAYFTLNRIPISQTCANSEKKEIYYSIDFENLADAKYFSDFLNEPGRNLNIFFGPDDRLGLTKSRGDCDSGNLDRIYVYNFETGRSMSITKLVRRIRAYKLSP